MPRAPKSMGGADDALEGRGGAVPRADVIMGAGGILRVILTMRSVDRKRVILFLVKGGRESHFGNAPCSQIDWGRGRRS
jgi:hypothetical protein